MKKSELVIGKSYWYNSSTQGWERTGSEVRLVSFEPTDVRWSQRNSKSLVAVEALRRNYTTDTPEWVEVNVPCSHLRGDYETLKKRAAEIDVEEKERYARERAESEAREDHYKNVYLPKFNRLNTLIESADAPKLLTSYFGYSTAGRDQIPEATLDLLIDALQIRSKVL